MANIKSAEKRNRQRIKRQARNRHQITTMRTYVKRVRAAIEAKDLAKASAALKEAVSIIDRTAQKGAIKKESASRKISRLTRAVAGASAAPAA